MWHSTKLFSSIFDLCPLIPKIYSPKFYRPLFTAAAAAGVDPVVVVITALVID